MAQFCTSCGSLLGEGAAFCTKCGARVGATTEGASPSAPAPQAARQPSPPSVSASPANTAASAAPSGKPGSMLIKVVLAVIVFGVVSVLGATIYVGYRVKKKADEVRQAYKSNDMEKLAAALGKSAGTAGNSGSSSNSNEPSGKPFASRNVCALVSLADVTEAVGAPIERAEPLTDGCQWFANPEALKQKGQGNIKNSFQKLNKQEPASFEQAQRTMEGLVKGVGALATASGPVLSVSVTWDNADQEELALKTAMRMMDPGVPGGDLEPIAGLGDRAYMGPVGSMLYVRKGQTWMALDLRQSPGSREQAIAFSRKLLAKL